MKTKKPKTKTAKRPAPSAPTGNVTWRGHDLVTTYIAVSSSIIDAAAAGGLDDERTVIAVEAARTGFWAPIAAHTGEERVMELIAYVEAAIETGDYDPDDVALDLPAGIMWADMTYVNCLSAIARVMAAAAPAVPVLDPNMDKSLVLNLVRKTDMAKFAVTNFITGLRFFWHRHMMVCYPDVFSNPAVIAAVDSMSYTAGAFLLRSLFALPYITEALLHDGGSN